MQRFSAVHYNSRRPRHHRRAARSEVPSGAHECGGGLRQECLVCTGSSTRKRRRMKKALLAGMRPSPCRANETFHTWQKPGQSQTIAYAAMQSA